MTAHGDEGGTPDRVRAVADRLDVRDTVLRVFVFTDRRRWDSLAALFAEQVRLDYTSLTGGEPSVLGGGDIAAAWREAMSGFKATQHLVGNVLVEVSDDTAVATAEAQATHHLPVEHGASRWTLGARYDFELTRASQGWRVSAMTMTALWGAGNQQLSELAAAARPDGSADPQHE